MARIATGVLGPEVQQSIQSIRPKSRMSLRMEPRPKMSDETTPTQPAAVPPSPTGTPIISPKAVPWIGIALSALATLATQLPDYTIGHKVLAVVLPGLTVLAGIFSPGLRKADGK